MEDRASRSVIVMQKFLTLEDEVVPMHHPRALIETAKAQGAAIEPLLLHTRIAPAMLTHPDARISYVSFGVLALNALRLTDNPALGLDFGRRMHVSNMGLLGMLVLSSRTADEALRAGLRFAPLLAPAWALSLEVRGEVACVHATPQLPFGTLQVFATESLLAAIWELARFVLGDEAPNAHARVDYPEPAHAARYRDLGGVTIDFGHTAIEVEFDAQVLARELRGGDPFTRELALRHCEAELAKTTSREGLLRCVQAMLSLRPGHYADLPSMARAMQTTPRTLRRELARLGTSYQEQLDSVRKQHVLELLGQTALTIEEIAQKVGLSDVRSVRRAVRRWTGLSPQAFRARAADPARP